MGHPNQTRHPLHGVYDTSYIWNRDLESDFPCPNPRFTHHELKGKADARSTLLLCYFMNTPLEWSMSGPLRLLFSAWINNLPGAPPSAMLRYDNWGRLSARMHFIHKSSLQKRTRQQKIHSCFHFHLNKRLPREMFNNNNTNYNNNNNNDNPYDQQLIWTVWRVLESVVGASNQCPERD